MIIMKIIIKKILYIVSTLKRSGPTNQLYNIIKYLDKDKFEFYLITLSPEPKDNRWKDYEALGVNLHSLDLSRLQGFIYAKKRVKLLISEIKPDLIHTQGIRGDLISSNIKTIVPKIATIRNIPQIDYKMTYGSIAGGFMCIKHKNALKKITCISVSNAVTANLRKKYRIENAFTIQNGVDTDAFFPANSDEKKILRKKLNLPLTGLIFIVSGHLTKRKNPLFILERWKEKYGFINNMHLVYIGSGNLLEQCKLASNGIDNIHIIGRIDNVADYLRCSDFFVSASIAEGLPNAVLEAMACGLPVLLSDIEPHREIMDLAPGAGFCYKTGINDNFLLFFQKMMDSDRKTMKMASLEAIKLNFSAKSMSEKYQNAYIQIFSSAESKA